MSANYQKKKRPLISSSESMRRTWMPQGSNPLADFADRTLDGTIISHSQPLFGSLDIALRPFRHQLN